jgi:hypothetical protein
MRRLAWPDRPIHIRLGRCGTPQSREYRSASCQCDYGCDSAPAAATGKLGLIARVSKPFGCQLMMTDTSRGETDPSIACRSHRSPLRHALVLPGDLADQLSGLGAERAPKVTRLGFAAPGPPGRRKSTSAGRPISGAPVRPVPADLPRGRTHAARTAAVRVPPIREADR